MCHILLLQLPIPQLNYGLKTGNIPLAAACLKQAGAYLEDIQVDILPESISSYLGDAALIRRILSLRPDVVGFSVFNWNIDRSRHVAAKLKEAYQPRIVFGGPEITKDNQRLSCGTADQLVYGPGESAWRELLGPLKKDKNSFDNRSVDQIFKSASSPYLLNLLEPRIDDVVYFESQRGCPYQCGFCYYNKSNDNTVFVDDPMVLDIVQWSLDHGIKELSLLDPSLNIRPGLKTMLQKIARVNRNKTLALSAEIRAEAIDAETADLFKAAGFIGFEIGHQTITPRALSIMRRSSDPKRFLKGVRLLKERGIVPRIDLIVGLPGDTPEGFRRSLSFVTDHGLCDDVQVFPLSILPGTHFRQNSQDLGLVFEEAPPYTVTTTPAFSSEDIFQAFEAAEEQLDTALFPAPHLNICLRNKPDEQTCFCDQWVLLDKDRCLCRMVIHSGQPLSDLVRLADRLTHPYQLLIPPGTDDLARICKALEMITAANPFTPFELIFIEPAVLPYVPALLGSIQLRRPHYLDNDLRFLHRNPGNRAVLFTLLSTKEQVCFQDDMQRQIFWWKTPRLPHQKDLESFSHLDGILIDSADTSPAIYDWQNAMAPFAPDLPPVCFAETINQKRWIALTMSDQFCLSVLPSA